MRFTFVLVVNSLYWFGAIAAACSADNCLRALLGSPVSASTFCATYTAQTIVATTGIPGFLANCQASPSRISSACSCFVTATTATTATLSTTTSTTSSATTSALTKATIATTSCPGVTTTVTVTNPATNTITVTRLSTATNSLTASDTISTETASVTATITNSATATTVTSYVTTTVTNVVVSTDSLTTQITSDITSIETDSLLTTITSSATVTVTSNFTVTLMNTATITTSVCSASSVSCPPGFTICSGNCQELSSDVNNCGTCGNQCSTANGTPVCSSGACGIAACNTGFADCNNNPADGCEVNIKADATSCGACNNHCSISNGTPVCLSGICEIAVCNIGFADCNGNPADGCEVNLTTDPTNCGACRHQCSTANGTPVCSSGTCDIAKCNAGFADCNNNAVDGCEINLLTDPTNCGICRNQCSIMNGTPTCHSGACAIGACKAGFADCNGNPADGCEVNLTTDPTNCGSCRHQCSITNGTPACSSGTCAIAGCNAGSADCNYNAADGCEVNLATDIHNCGSCGNACSSINGTPSCSAGVCSIVCNAGFGDCNHNVADGCEIDLLSNDSGNCGGCGVDCSFTCSAGKCSFLRMLL